MRKVIFENRYYEKIVIGAAETKENVWKIIHDFLVKHNYKAPYIRSWEDEEGLHYDVGSHSEFFLWEASAH